jgi:hypothetical protein
MAPSMLLFPLEMLLHFLIMPRYLSSRWPLYILSLPYQPHHFNLHLIHQIHMLPWQVSEYCYHSKGHFTHKDSISSFSVNAHPEIPLELRFHIDIRNNLTYFTHDRLFEQTVVSRWSYGKLIIDSELLLFTMPSHHHNISMWKIGAPT